MPLTQAFVSRDGITLWVPTPDDDNEEDQENAGISDNDGQQPKAK